MVFLYNMPNVFAALVALMTRCSVHEISTAALASAGSSVLVRGGAGTADTVVAPKSEIRRNHDQVPLHRCPDESRDDAEHVGIASGLKP